MDGLESWGMGGEPVVVEEREKRQHEGDAYTPSRHEKAYILSTAACSSGGRTPIRGSCAV